jgi:hypothetical protein
MIKIKSIFLNIQIIRKWILILEFKIYFPDFKIEILNISLQGK